MASNAGASATSWTRSERSSRCWTIRARSAMCSTSVRPSRCRSIAWPASSSTPSAQPRASCTSHTRTRTRRASRTWSGASRTSRRSRRSRDGGRPWGSIGSSPTWSGARGPPFRARRPSGRSSRPSQPDDLWMPAARHTARVDHKWRVADDLREIDGRVSGKHHDDVLRRKAFGSERLRPEPPVRQHDRWYERVVIGHLGPVRPQPLEDDQRWRLADVVDVLLVGHADAQHLRAAQWLALVVERLRYALGDEARHLRVDLLRVFDEG